VWVIPSFFAVCHGLNYKDLHDFEKRMIIRKLLGGGAAAPLAPPPRLLRPCNNMTGENKYFRLGK
jgi:hypothetical protein